MAKINIQLNTKYFLPLAIIVAGLIIAGAIVFTRTSQPPVNVPTVNVPKEPKTAQPSLPNRAVPSKEFIVTENDHLRGDFSAPITIVEYSDFQCPFCQRFHPTVQQILADYSGKVRWVYKHFPLDSIHSQARPAAEASECVWEQKGNDGFWRFADGIFENQEGLGEGLYKELATQIGVDLDRFNSCFSSRKYKDKVEADYQEGIKAGIRGTPGSFVNGEEIPGAMPYEYLKDAVERALSSL